MEIQLKNLTFNESVADSRRVSNNFSRLTLIFGTKVGSFSGEDEPRRGSLRGKDPLLSRVSPTDLGGRDPSLYRVSESTGGSLGGKDPSLSRVSEYI